MATERLEAEICSVSAHIAAATCRFLLLLGEFDRRKGYEAWECLSTAAWLNWKCGTSLHTAREQVRVARRLPEMPAATQAFSCGRLSYSKVRAISRVAHPGIEEGLVSMAEHATAQQIERACSALRRCADLDAEEARLRAGEETGRARAHLSLHTDDSGHGVGRLRLSPLDHDVVSRALAAAADQLDPIDGEPADHRRARALTAMAAAYLAHPETGDGPRPEVVVHVDLTTLADVIDSRPSTASPAGTDFPTDADFPTDDTGDPGAAEAEPDHGDGADVPAGTSVTTDSRTLERELRWPVRTSRGAPLSVALLARLVSDAGIRHVADLPDGTQLDLGRHHRIPDAALRRALLARDVHCRFPGCTSSQNLHAHHIVWWILGGRTDADNLLMLCRKHHHAIHDRQWTLTGTASAPVFRRPDGQLAPTFVVPPSGDVAELLAQHEQYGLDVAVEHPGGFWCGDRIDWDCFFAAFANPVLPPQS